MPVDLTTPEGLAQAEREAEERRLARVRRIARRKVVPPPLISDHKSALWADTIMSLWPWRKGEYPGYSNCASEAFRLERRTVHRYRYPGVTVSSRVALRVASYLRHKAQQLLDIASAWDAYAATTEAQAPPRRRLRELRLAEIDGWRSKPRVLGPKRTTTPKRKPSPDVPPSPPTCGT